MSSNVSPTQVVVNFTPGNLGEVFSQLNFELSEQIGADKITTVQSNFRGITFLPRSDISLLPSPQDGSSPCDNNPNTIEIDDSGDLTAGTGNNGSGDPSYSANAGLHLEGMLQFCPTVTFKVQSHYVAYVVPVLDGASIAAGLDLYSHVSAWADAALTLNKTVPIAEMTATEIPIPDTGGVLYLTPKLTLLLGMEGTFNGKVAMGISQQASGSVEVDYDAGSSNISTQNNTSVSNPVPDAPDIEAAASAKASLGLKTELDLNAGLPLINVNLASVGGYIEPRVYLQANADINQNPWWTIDAGLEAIAGMNFEFLGASKSFDSDPIPLWNHELLRAPGPFLKSISLSSVSSSSGSSTITSSHSTQSVTLIGNGFASDLVVQSCFLSSCQKATVSDPTSTTALVDVLYDHAGTWQVQVFNADGSFSPILNVSVEAPAVRPHIDGVSPQFLQQRVQNQPISFNGYGFEDELTVKLCTSVCYRSLSGTQIESVSSDSISALATLTAGNWTAQVINPDGGASNIYPFTVQPPFTASVLPGIGVVGTSFLVSGAGATPNGTVLMVSTSPNGQPISSSLPTSATGTFAAPSFVPTEAGAYNNVLTDPTKNSTTSVGFLVQSQQTVTGPNAHFTMSANGQSASDNQTLTLTMQSGGPAPQVTFTSTSIQGSVPITSYVWKSNGTQFCIGAGASCTAPFSTPSNTISLTVTDSNGKTSSPATGTVIVNTQAPVTGPTAHFTMASPGVSTVSDGGTLTLTMQSGGPAPQVTFTSTSIQGSVPITSYVWKSNGTQFCTTATCSYAPPTTSGTSCTAPTVIFNVTLIVTDNNGKSSQASGTISTLIAGPYITFVTSPLKAAPDTQLQTMYIDGINFSTQSQGGYLTFTDTINGQHSSKAFPSRVITSSSTQWVYTIGDNNDIGTWYVQMFDSSGNASNVCPFQVQ